MSTTPVSVVVPSRNRAARLPMLVEPLLAEPELREVVIVVDGSRDGSIEYLESRAARDPRLVPVLIEHSGEGAARRAGVERASGDVVLLLDDDVIPEPGLATRHARHHAGRPGVVVLGYMPVATEPSRRTATQDLYARAYERVCAGYEEDPDSTLEGLWAGNVSLRRDDWMRVERIESKLPPGYHADRDFGLRCIEAGLHGVFDRSLLAHHHYERDLDAYLRDSYSSGYARRLLHQLHPALGPLPGDFYRRDLRIPGRWFVALAARRRAGRLGRRVLEMMRAVAAALHLRSVEVHVTHVLATGEAVRGAIDAAHAGPHVHR